MDQIRRFCLFFLSTENCLLLFFFLGVVSPYAVVKRGGEAQPGQVGRHQQSGSAADGIPRRHGGSDGPGEKHNLNKCLNWAERGR